MTHSHSSYQYKEQNSRLRILHIFVFVFAFLLVYRLLDLQVFSGKELRASALNQHSTVRSLPAERGEIFFGDVSSEGLYSLATNRVFKHVYIVPRDIKNTESAFNILWPLVEEKGMDKDTLRYRLSKSNDIYEPLVSKLNESELEKFKGLNLEGLGWEDETWRYYPEQETLAHLLGFVGLKDGNRVGQYGLEGYYQDELEGEEGILEGDTDITGTLIQTGYKRRIEPEKGADIILTIDRTIQAFACQKLAEYVEDLSAAKGTVVIVHPKTGAVIAMCSVPTFNPNTYNEVEDISIYLNPAISESYEPGSVFKPVTMAAAIDSGKITPETTFVDEGNVKIGKYTIRNSDGKAHGEVDMVYVLNKSLNTGTIFIQRETGKEIFRDYVHKFGFGRITDVELGNELAADISSLDKRGDIFAATASYGQGITVTPLQLVMAYAAIANEGKLMKPYIIKETRKNDKIEITEPSVVQEAISLRAATIVSAMMVSVIEDGHAKSAGVDNYFIAGKTGTAQVAQAGKYGESTIHSFAGFGPVDNPEFAMLVKLDHPQVGVYAASTAAPLFGEIAKFVLQYLEVAPDENI
jgi:stage V sporulation protein D (sporulation-specific penicillin-binding protein)